MSRSLIAELSWRGVMEQATPDLLEGRVQDGLLGYAGFDPTSNSLHLGNLVPVLGLMRLQRAGHRPIVVVGGATGLIGDPSGKATERTLMTRDQVEANVDAIRGQFDRFLDFSGSNAAMMVNNYDWLGSYGLVEYLRDIGKHFRVSYMLGKESVRSRIEDRDQGMSFTEFSYMLLQATDYLHLHERYGCNLQMGGNDQWGNITAGIDLIRRVTGSHVHGLTFPLLTTASGAKFGKSESGALWLDKDRTSSYELYQYLFRTDDRDAIGFLKLFTFLSQEQIGELAEVQAKNPEPRDAQRTLAYEVVQLVHGTAEAESAVRASQVLFGAPLSGLDDRQIRNVFTDVPSMTAPFARLEGNGWALVDALVETQLASSKGDARRKVEAGGVYVNNERVADTTFTLSPANLAGGTTVVLRTGKKTYYLIRFGQN